MPPGHGHAEIGDLEAWAMVESAPDGMLLVDDEGHIVTANAQMESMFGFDRAEILGRPVEDLLPARYHSAHISHRGRFATGPASRPMGTGLDLWAQRKNGTEFPVEISLSPIGSGDGPLIIASVRDVTERLALEARTNLISNTIDAAQDGVFMFEPETMQFSYVNQGASAQLGYTDAELLTMTPLDIAPTFTEEALRELFAPVVEGRMASQRFTTSLRRKDGAEVPVELVLEYPEAERTGDDRMMIAIVRDISSRVRAEAERDRQNAWLHALADIRSMLLEGHPLPIVLEMVCEHACALVQSVDSFVVANDVTSGLRVVAADGDHDPDALDDQVARAGSWLEEILDIGEGVTIDVAAPASVEAVGSAFADLALGPLVVAPMSGNDRQVIGALLVARPAGGQPFDATELQLVKTLAHEAVTAIAVERNRASSARMTLLEERERIAGDLHDMVIQRLFAAGMSLQIVQSVTTNQDMADRLSEAVSELDLTISEIRATIFRLNTPATTVREELETVVRSRAASLGFEPVLDITGDPEQIGDAVATELIPTLTEALTNVARHAHATEAVVTIDIEPEQVVLRVADDGIGLGEYAPRGNGLNSLARRARRLDGSFTFETNAEGGTTLTWRALTEI